MGRRGTPLLSKRGFLSSPNPTSLPQHDQEFLDPWGVWEKKTIPYGIVFFYAQVRKRAVGSLLRAARVRKTGLAF